jgi:maleate isomerase
MPIKRLGVLTPSSNTVVEPETVRLLPADGSVTAHFARVRVVQISDSDASLRQFELEPMLAAADLLADAAVDLMVWNGTAAAWLGFERDQRLVEAIAARTGIPATSALLAINQRLRRLGARRLGFVSNRLRRASSRIIAPPDFRRRPRFDATSSKTPPSPRSRRTRSPRWRAKSARRASMRL